MKKVIFFVMMCLMAFSICAVFSCTEKNNGASGDSEASGKYVDLGLPSGTKWKDVNESTGEFNLYSYDQAIQNFGDKIPTKEQFEELQTCCMWTWTGNSYKIVGPNGKNILLPAAGLRSCEGNVSNVDSDGIYWSSTPSGSLHAWCLGFGSSGGTIYPFDQCYGLSVRLVQD